MNLYLLSLLVVEFTQGMDSCYQYHHDTWTMSMRHIFYFYLPLFPFLHPRLYPYKIHFISFLVLSPLKLRLYQVEFHPDPQKWSHFMSSESLTPWHGFWRLFWVFTGVLLVWTDMTASILDDSFDEALFIFLLFLNVVANSSPVKCTNPIHIACFQVFYETLHFLIYRMGSHKWNLNFEISRVSLSLISSGHLTLIF